MSVVRLQTQSYVVALVVVFGGGGGSSSLELSVWSFTLEYEKPRVREEMRIRIEDDETVGGDNYIIMLHIFLLKIQICRFPEWLSGFYFLGFQ